MDFLLSLNGLLYNTPALFLLALLIWKRPYTGIVMSGFAFTRVVGPFIGMSIPLDASVHMILAVVTAFAWSWGEGWTNVLLFIGGVLLFFFTAASVGRLLPDTQLVADHLWRGVKIGGMLAALRAVAYVLFEESQKKKPHHTRRGVMGP